MTFDTRWRSPLAHRVPLGSADTLHLKEQPFVGIVVLRGDAEAIGAAVHATLGLSLPRSVGQTAVGQTAATADITALWQSPDEWLLLTAPGGQTGVIDRLTPALDGLHQQIVDVSDYETTIEIAGPATRPALAKLIALDLHPRAMAAGQAVATTLGRSTIRLWLVRDGDAGPLFRLVIRRSHADYVWCLLAEAGREWGLPPQEPFGLVPLSVAE